VVLYDASDNVVSENGLKATVFVQRQEPQAFTVTFNCILPGSSAFSATNSANIQVCGIRLKSSYFGLVEEVTVDQYTDVSSIHNS
jgi:hypothetical protein